MHGRLFNFLTIEFFRSFHRPGHEPITEEDQRPLTHEELKEKILKDVSSKGGAGSCAPLLGALRWGGRFQMVSG